VKAFGSAVLGIEESLEKTLLTKNKNNQKENRFLDIIPVGNMPFKPYPSLPYLRRKENFSQGRASNHLLHPQSTFHNSVV
jgi:hypothetical protein